ncbi:MAG: hypothetical protein RR177_03140 [Oscillospiraceae bacterium]
MYLFKLIPCVLRHPLNTFRLIKADRKNFSYLPAVVLYLLFVVVRIASIFIVHYPLAQTDPADANLLLEIVFCLLPTLSLAITFFGLSSILDGESKLGENITAVGFCLVPYIVFQLPISLLTRILGTSEAGLYNWLVIAIWAWVVLLFIINVAVLNGYTIFKTFLVIFLALACVFLFWATLFLLYALLNQFILFIQGVARELKFVLFS